MMDNIDECISANLHLTDNFTLINKTWNDFFQATQNKKLILYGLTDITEFLWLRCENKIVIEAAIDNNNDKQNHRLDELFDETTLHESRNVKISSKNILENYQTNEVVILISSLRRYEEIARELEEKNFNCYFSILHLEYNYRKNKESYKTLADYKKEFSKNCVEKFPIESNKILIYMGNYIEHGKCITEALLKANDNLDIVWIVDKISINAPEGVRTIYNGKWKQYCYELETAKIWIYNAMPVPIYSVKREGQYYIQTKHWGSITLKKFGLDDPAVKNSQERQMITKINSKWTDYIITGSELDENSCRSGFNFNGKFLRFGSPRSDILFNPEHYKEKIYKYFKLNSSDHILIYAPTFRAHSKQKYFMKWQNLNFDLLIESLKQKWNGEWKIFLRLHPFVKFSSKQVKLSDKLIDVSNYENSQELLAASDILISDFSSIIFEPAYVMKPVFLFAPDKDEYEKNDRELLIRYDKLPFPISTNNEELTDQIKNFDEENYRHKIKNFFDHYGVKEDGHASERTAEFIIDLLSR